MWDLLSDIDRAQIFLMPLSGPCRLPPLGQALGSKHATLPAHPQFGSVSPHKRPAGQSASEAHTGVSGLQKPALQQIHGPPSP